MSGSILIILEKIFFLLSLIGCGILAKKLELISDKGVDDLSKLILDFFWPALIFFQITSALNAEDIIKNISLPFFAILTAVTGLFLGKVIAKIMKYKEEERQLFLYNSTINNFVFMVIPFVELYYPKNGLGLLFIHNIGFILIVWTVGVFLFQGRLSLLQSIKGLINPGLISTFSAILITITGLNGFIPSAVSDIFKTMGTPTVAISMIVAGAQIYKLGRNAFKFNLWNILLGLNRLILIPGILFVLSIFLKNIFDLPREVLGIFMIVNAMPVSIISVSMAMRYNSDSNLAAQGVVSNHLFSILTIPFFILLIEKFLI